MELDGESLEGHWATDNNLGVEFFIINDAVFSKLCILGDDVEPCYEGSSVTSLEVDSNFSKNNKKFEHTLFTMMQELKDTLSKGGLNVATEKEEFVEIEDTLEQEVEEITPEEVTDFSEDNESVSDKGEDKDEPEAKEQDSEVEDEELFEEDDSEEDNPEPSFTAEQFNALQSENELLRAEVAELREFKLNIENQQKKALIDSYFMLSDEDKADVINNMSNYSFDDIKAKLAILYVEKNVDFSRVDGQSEKETSPALSFSLEEETNQETLTDLQRALRETQI